MHLNSRNHYKYDSSYDPYNNSRNHDNSCTGNLSTTDQSSRSINYLQFVAEDALFKMKFM